MYAIIQDGGHQYKVAPGETHSVQLKTAEVGDTITFDQVSAIGGDEPRFGTPFVEGATVIGTVVRHGKAKKLNVFFFRRRKDSRRKLGHRQKFTEIKIDAING